MRYESTALYVMKYLKWVWSDGRSVGVEVIQTSWELKPKVRESTDGFIRVLNFCIFLLYPTFYPFLKTRENLDKVVVVI